MEECQRDIKELPELSLPGCTLFRLHGTSFLLVFGGYYVDEEIPSSDLIVINLRFLEWWFADVQGGPVTARIDPTIVAIDQRLYVFGGYRNFTDSGDPHSSYSIAALSEDGSTWNWDVIDASYSSDVPEGTIFGGATPVYKNYEKILLTPWRTTNSDVSRKPEFQLLTVTPV
jgi:hypothetical protein